MWEDGRNLQPIFFILNANLKSKIRKKTRQEEPYFVFWGKETCLKDRWNDIGYYFLFQFTKYNEPPKLAPLLFKRRG